MIVAAGGGGQKRCIQGEPLADPAILSGEVRVFCGVTQPSTIAEQIKADRICLAATVNSKHLPSQPDVSILMESGFQIKVGRRDGIPTLHGFCIRGTGKDFSARGWINAPVLIGDVTVSAGDLIVGDGDGVVAIPRASAADAVDAGQRREVEEQQIIQRIKSGESTLDIYGWN